MLGWSLLILASYPLLWLWSLLARRARRHASPPPSCAEQAKRGQPERRPVAEVFPLVKVKAGGVPPGVGGRRIPLRPPGAASALATPVHRLTLAGETVAMAEKSAADHLTFR